VISLIHTASR